MLNSKDRNCKIHSQASTSQHRWAEFHQPWSQHHPGPKMTQDELSCLGWREHVSMCTSDGMYLGDPWWPLIYSTLVVSFQTRTSLRVSDTILYSLDVALLVLGPQLFASGAEVPFCHWPLHGFSDAHLSRSIASKTCTYERLLSAEVLQRIQYGGFM